MCIGISEDDEENGTETILEELMSENHSKMMNIKQVRLHINK